MKTMFNCPQKVIRHLQMDNNRLDGHPLHYTPSTKNDNCIDIAITMSNCASSKEITGDLITKKPFLLGLSVVSNIPHPSSVMPM